MCVVARILCWSSAAMPAPCGCSSGFEEGLHSFFVDLAFAVGLRRMVAAKYPTPLFFFSWRARRGTILNSTAVSYVEFVLNPRHLSSGPAGNMQYLLHFSEGTSIVVPEGISTIDTRHPTKFKFI